MVDIKEQLKWLPEIERPRTDAKENNVVMGGMGGSALAMHILPFLNVAYPTIVHEDYDIPEHCSSDAHFISVSYSGNTEETISFAKAVLEKGYSLSVVSSGGELAKLAEEKSLPFVRVPEGLVPRDGIVYLAKAILALVGEDQAMSSINSVSIDEESVRSYMASCMDAIGEGIPVIYTSTHNATLGRIWKLYLNETAKMPAFSHTFSALNHGEMQSLGHDGSHPDISKMLRPLVIRDPNDDVRIIRRMDVFCDLMKEQGTPVYTITLPNSSRVEQFVHGWFMAQTAAREYAIKAGLDPSSAPLVAEFKKRL